MSRVTQHYSDATLSFIAKYASSSAVLDPSAGTLVVKNVFWSGKNIIADLTQGADAQSLVFIKEGGDWKLDITATGAYSVDHPNG